MHGTIENAGETQLREAREKANSMRLEDFNPGDPELFQTDTHWPYFDRLRKEDPVHYCRDSEFGPYWSVTKYNDIMDVETNHQVYSSDSSLGGITELTGLHKVLGDLGLLNFTRQSCGGLKISCANGEYVWICCGDEHWNPLIFYMSNCMHVFSAPTLRSLASDFVNFG